jgi:hypothetical protein
MPNCRLPVVEAGVVPAVAANRMPVAFTVDDVVAAIPEDLS